MTASSPMHRLLAPWIAEDVFDFWVSRVNPTWSWQRPLARVVSRHVEARDTVTLELRTNRHFAGLVAGQHVNVTAEVDGVRVTRSYSPTHIPNGDRRLALTVKKVDGGRLSTHLVEHSRVGDVLELSPAFGQMVWPERITGQWLLLAAGSGITPLISLTRAWARSQGASTLTLCYWAKTEADLCFAEELRELAERDPRFHLHMVLTEPHAGTAAAHTEYGSRLDAEWLDRTLHPTARQQVYACGPAGFVDTARALLEDASSHFAAEAFTLPEPIDNVAGTVRVELRSSARTLELPAGQSLLTALESHGVHPPHGCRMGICNSCACGKLSGTTQDLQSGARDAEPNNALRLCISRACSDLILDL